MRLEGKVAIVTGAGQGMGRAVARRLAQDGATIVATDIIPETVQAVAGAINKNGGKAVAVVADLTGYDEACGVVQAGLDKFGHIDILCNVAGIGPGGKAGTFGRKFCDLSPEDWRTDIGHNVYTCLNCSKAVAGQMMERRSGKIVNWEAGASLVGSEEGISIYMSSKGFIYTFTKCLAKELGPYNINVNSLAAGSTAVTVEALTGHGLSEGQAREFVERRTQSIPLRRMGTNEDVADVAAFLVSEDARWITGQSISPSGGQFMR